MTQSILPGGADASVAARKQTGPSRARGSSKKQRILDTFRSGISDPAEIAAYTEASPSYVAQVLRAAGLLDGYFDLYTSTANEQNVYSRYFRGVLSFRDVAAARASVQRIDELYRHFEQIGDRAGQHQAMVIALTGQNRARWSGKTREAAIFREWLCQR
jgi:hypothetical protein